MAAVKVLTFNIWGLHYLAKRIKERLVFIAEELAGYDIVCLQEVWSVQDYNYLRKKLEKSLPYCHCFFSGIIGSGLCIFSRHPITSAYCHTFSVGGGIHELSDGEIFAGKGVMACRILTPGGQMVVFNTHLNPRRRDNQLFELVQMVEQSRGCDLVLVTGDFNTKPDTHCLQYNLLVKCLGLQDVFQDDPVDTCDLRSNIFTLSHMTPKRIDFIFFSDEFAANNTMTVKEKKLALSGTIPGQDIPYSDHEGVEATFVLEERAKPLPHSGPRLYSEAAIEVFQGIAQNIKRESALHHTTSGHAIGTWIGLFILMLLASIVLSHQSVFGFMAMYNVQWLCTGLTGLAGVLTMVVVMKTFSGIQLVRAMEANVNQIELILEHSTRVCDGELSKTR